MSWELGIDFGTSYTVAAIAKDGNVTTVDVESNGRSRLPSCVFLSLDGQILVGTAAQHQAVFAPERYEPTPKRVLSEGELFLGDRVVPVTELAAAVFKKVYREACAQEGQTVPSKVRVTHPADWNDSRKSVLREAVEKAGISTYELVDEPVAAAVRISLAATQPGQTIAVYDFGGGTFDAAVLQRTTGGFEIAGPPAGRDPLGGEDIDIRIINYLGEVLGDEYPEDWPKLISPPDASWRHKSTDLREEVQRAKETLSEVGVCQLWVPGIERDIQLTRTPELEDLIKDDIEATVDCLEQALEDANVKAKDLAGIYLVGGSSRIPLVGATIYRRLNVKPMVQDNPKSVVAMGAAAWDMGRTMVQAPPPPPPPLPPATPPQPARPTGTGGEYQSGVVMAIGIDAWPQGCTCVAEVVVEYPGQPGVSLRARDEPAAVKTVHQLAAQVGSFRAARTPGFVQGWVGPAQVLGQDGVERRFQMASPRGTIAMFEQYLLVDDRAIVVAGQESTRAISDHDGAPPADHAGRSMVREPLHRRLSPTLAAEREGESPTQRLQPWGYRRDTRPAARPLRRRLAKAPVRLAVHRFSRCISREPYRRSRAQPLRRRDPHRPVAEPRCRDAHQAGTRRARPDRLHDDHHLAFLRPVTVLSACPPGSRAPRSRSCRFCRMSAA